MNYIEKVVELVNDIALGSMYGNYEKLDNAVELVTALLGWKSMDTAPKDRGILVYNKPPNKYGVKSDDPCYLAVHWSTWSYEWIVNGSSPDREGDYPVASYPVAWMELPEYDN